MKRGIYVVGCICLALAVMAAPASAKKKKKKPASLGPVSTVTAVGPVVGPGNASTATATCPAGTQAVGGGWSAPFTVGGAVVVYESYRSAPGAWTASGVVGIGAGGVTAFGYCRRVNGTLSDSTGASPLANGTGSQATASASCPAGTKLISGGFQSTRVGTSVGAPQDNYSSTAGVWTFRASNSAANGPVTITAHAYCMGGLKPSTFLSATTSATVPQAGTSSPTTGACPKPKKKKKKKGKKRKKSKPQLLSAGGFTSAASGLVVFTDNRLDGTGWRATGANASGGIATLTVTAQGICA